MTLFPASKALKYLQKKIFKPFRFVVTIQSQNPIIKHFDENSYETASDDRNAYYRKVAREHLFPIWMVHIE